MYPIGCIPAPVTKEISKRLVYSAAVGKADIAGDEWGDIFAKAIGGVHLASPVGLADVVKGQEAWSIKTVKHNTPHNCRSVRIISGRNNLTYSYGIENPFNDVQHSGTCVLDIWNERLNLALDNYSTLRTVVLIRNMDIFEFAMFEIDTHRLLTAEYVWTVNANNNFVAHDRTKNAHKFTWQPNGSQFTIKHSVPASAIRFKVHQPPVLDYDKTMQQIGFDDSWVDIL